MTSPTTRARATTLRRLALVALAGTGLAACQSITDLDETALTTITPDKFYQTDAQAQAAVNAAYSPLMGWNGWIQPAQHSIMCDEDQMSCESWMGGEMNGMYGGQWYAQNNAVWFGDYQIIERANEALLNIPTSTGVSEAMKQKALGQAKFIRAYAYFDLVRRYGGVPLKTTPYQPDLKLGAQARAPIDSIWRQITTDLWQAAQALPATFDPTTGQGLPRRAAAYGLLAKVYMHMAGAEVAGSALAANRNTYLDSAAFAARQVVQDGTVGLEANYMDLFDVDKQGASREILFAIQGARVNPGGSNVVPFFAPAGDCSLAGGCGPAGPGFVTLRNDFVRSFDPADVRMKPGYSLARAWRSLPQSQSKLGTRERRVIHQDSLRVLAGRGLLVDTTFVAGDGWQQACSATRLWPGFYRLTLRDPANTSVTTIDTVALPRPHFTLKYTDRGNTGSEYGNKNNFIVLRHADVLLLLAEAINERSGPTGEAIGAVNQVRQRAGLPALAGSATGSQTAFREAIRAERGKELYAEFQRRFDLIRWGVYAAPDGPMNRPVTNEFTTAPTVCRPRQAFQVLQPIPNAELAANPMLTQNPGW
jgi:hypothetical protein